jgi:tripartite-type tricarboxylate transporter receptor subunit TctC
MARLLFAIILGALAGNLHAQDYPNKPIRMLLGYAAGGPSDLGARLFADSMAATLGQSVVVENRPGASGQIAHDALRASPADGYTIEFYATPTLLSSLLVAKPVSASEIAHIALVYETSSAVLVNPAAPLMANVQTLKDLVAVAKANPGKVTYTSAGTGSTGHLSGAWLGIGEGIKWEHIAYKGIAPASVDVVAGRIPVMFGALTSDQQLVKEGKIRVVSTVGGRSARWPAAPSLAEAGYGQYSLTTWGGFAAPAGTSRASVDRLAAGVRSLFDKPELVARVGIQLGDPRFQPGEVLERRMREDIENFTRIIREAGIKAE